METNFLFVGDRACLDFVNTELISGGMRVDTLQTSQEVFAWLHESGLWKAAQKARAEEWAANEETASAQLLEKVRAFRGVLRNMAETLVKTGMMPVDTEINAINVLLRSRPVYEQITKKESGGLVNTFVPLDTAPSVPDEVLATLAQAARDLLVSADLSLVKQCGGQGCILFFLDITKNHKRCWCSMAGCGNRAKAAAHYQRVRAAKKREG